MKRCLVLVLLPLLVLGNAFAHAHGSFGGDDQADRPHIHLSGHFEHRHGHRHDHAQGHRHHDHDGEGEFARAGERAETLTTDLVLHAPDDHDADAVYVLTPSVYRSTAKVSVDAAPAIVWMGGDAVVPMSPTGVDRLASSPLCRPPAQPLFVLHAALRL